MRKINNKLLQGFNLYYDKLDLTVVNYWLLFDFLRGR